jgi:16S rRNA (uracil1498-N3)-methyltransferase
MAHVVYLPELQAAQAGEVVSILGPEAHHAARVKRCEAGDRVGLRNGRGLAALASIDAIRKGGKGEWRVDARVIEAEVVHPREPRVEVCASPPKGEHLAAMIDGLSQVGVASWSALRTRRTVVEPRSGKLERLERVCEESLKQCGRAWLMEVGDAMVLDDAVRAGEGLVVVLADQSGEAWGHAWERCAGAARDARCVRVLVGPEGGFTEDEIGGARAAGAVVARFGPHAMRIETAAVVAGASVVMHTA